MEEPGRIATVLALYADQLSLYLEAAKMQQFDQIKTEIETLLHRLPDAQSKMGDLLGRLHAPPLIEPGQLTDVLGKIAEVVKFVTGIIDAIESAHASAPPPPPPA